MKAAPAVTRCQERRRLRSPARFGVFVVGRTSQACGLHDGAVLLKPGLDGFELSAEVDEHIVPLRFR